MNDNDEGWVRRAGLFGFIAGIYQEYVYLAKDGSIKRGLPWKKLGYRLSLPEATSDFVPEGQPPTKSYRLIRVWSTGRLPDEGLREEARRYQALGEGAYELIWDDPRVSMRPELQEVGDEPAGQPPLVLPGVRGDE